MLTGNCVSVIENELAFLRDEHVSTILQLANGIVEKIEPNQPIPITVLLKQYNQSIHVELNRYGNALQNKLATILNGLQPYCITPADKDRLLSILENSLQPEWYQKRFNILIQSITTHLKRFGISFDKSKYRIDIPESLNQVGTVNMVRKIKSKINNDLDLMIERNYIQVLQQQDSMASTSVQWRLDRFYQAHPFLFWLIALFAGIAVAL